MAVDGAEREAVRCLDEKKSAKAGASCLVGWNGNRGRATEDDQIGYEER
jgi:hypothetical protein